MRIMDTDLLRSVLPKRTASAHKGTFGTLTLVCGCDRYRGAAALAAEGALRVGTGIVRLASTERVCAAVAARLPACTFVPVPEGPDGKIASLQGVSPGKTSAWLCGCGLGNTPATAALVAQLLGLAQQPVVLDGDALGCLAGALESGPDSQAEQKLQAALQNCGAPVVLTPHLGEMARLCGQTTAEIEADQAGVAAAYAQSNHCTVVLKSHTTVVAAPDGTVLVNNTAGNAGLARGGSGDVLAGLIAGLLAQGLAPADAAAAGVFLHASAADLLAQQWGMAGLSIADLPAAVARVLANNGY